LAKLEKHYSPQKKLADLQENVRHKFPQYSHHIQGQKLGNFSKLAVLLI
jgi:hypothetical protein